MNNIEFRRLAAQKSVKLWQVAERLGMADFQFSRKLRHEMSDGLKNRAIAAVEEIAAERR